MILIKTLIRSTHPAQKSIQSPVPSFCVYCHRVYGVPVLHVTVHRTQQCGPGHESPGVRTKVRDDNGGTLRMIEKSFSRVPKENVTRQYIGQGLPSLGLCTVGVVVLITWTHTHTHIPPREHTTVLWIVYVHTFTHVCVSSPGLPSYGGCLPDTDTLSLSTEA